MAARGFGSILDITSSWLKALMNILALSNGVCSGLTGFVAGLARTRRAARGVTINNLLPGAAIQIGQPLETVMDARRKNVLV